MESKPCRGKANLGYTLRLEFGMWFKRRVGLTGNDSQNQADVFMKPVITHGHSCVAQSTWRGLHEHQLLFFTDSATLLLRYPGVSQNCHPQSHEYMLPELTHLLRIVDREGEKKKNSPTHRIQMAPWNSFRMNRTFSSFLKETIQKHPFCDHQCELHRHRNWI